VQIDVKFIEPLTTSAASTTAGSSAGTATSGAPNSPARSGRRGKYYQFTAIDDCTRLRVLRIYPQCNQKTAIQFVDYVLDRLPFKVEVIQTDNGAEFQTAFHWHVQDKGIGHVYINPAHPDSTVKSNARIASMPKNSTVYSTASSSTTPKYSTTNSKEWEDYYNYHRPHGALGGQTPYERLRQKTHPAVADLPQPHMADAFGASRQSAWERFRTHSRWNRTHRLSRLRRVRRAAMLRRMALGQSDEFVAVLRQMVRADRASSSLDRQLERPAGSVVRG
jgi:hypothetical protein